MLGLDLEPFDASRPFGHVSAIPVVSEHPAMLGGKLADAVQEAEFNARVLSVTRHGKNYLGEEMAPREILDLGRERKRLKGKKFALVPLL